MKWIVVQHIVIHSLILWRVWQKWDNFHSLLSYRSLEGGVIACFIILCDAWLFSAFVFFRFLSFSGKKMLQPVATTFFWFVNFQFKIFWSFLVVHFKMVRRFTLKKIHIMHDNRSRCCIFSKIRKIVNWIEN